MKSLLEPSLNEISETLTNIDNPGLPVEVQIDRHGVLRVNVGPACILRIGMVDKFILNVDNGVFANLPGGSYVSP
jgi:hypothetical protein